MGLLKELKEFEDHCIQHNMEQVAELVSNAQIEITKLERILGHEKEYQGKLHSQIDRLKQNNVNMKRVCNERYSEQLQKIRKLEAEKMVQIQSKLFEDD